MIDVARVLAGPYAAMLLGDLGARVIKVERPDGGDETRRWGPPFIGENSSRVSTYFVAANRNKESIALDLRDDFDRCTFEELLSRADVLVENFRPGVMERLGFPLDELTVRYPRLVTLAISGFGTRGPDAQRAAYDQIVQGEAGLMSLTGMSEREPTKIGIPVTDIMAGTLGTLGVVAALHERTRTGRGRVVHTSLLSAAIACHTFQGTRWLVGHEVPGPSGNAHPTVAPYGAFRCQDGVLQLAVNNENLWQRFALLIGVDPDDERFQGNEQRTANSGELQKVIERAFAKKPAEEWLRTLSAAGIPAGKIQGLDKVYSSEQVLAEGLIAETEYPDVGTLQLPGVPITFDDEDGTAHEPPPRLDEHAAAIRKWLSEDSGASDL